MKRDDETDALFFAGKRSKEMPFVVNDTVLITNGPYQERLGAVISPAPTAIEPSFQVELSEGRDIVVRADDLALVNVAAPFSTYDRPPPLEVVTRLWREQFEDAHAMFLSGSVIRGAGYRHSDLDVVVLCKHVERARRESHRVEEWPVELFVHDPETLTFFVDQDCQSGVPSLAHMLAHAVVVPKQSALTERIQRWARDILDAPPLLKECSLQNERYFLSDLVDDLRDPRPREELIAAGCRLYPKLGNFVLRTANRWGASGKSLPVALRAHDPALYEELHAALDAPLIHGEPVPLIQLAERIPEPFGGTLFDGYRSDAEANMRKPAPVSFFGA